MILLLLLAQIVASSAAPATTGYPTEARADYESARGYVLARTVRALAFFLVFLPLAAIPALIARLGRLIIVRKPQPTP